MRPPFSITSFLCLLLCIGLSSGFTRPAADQEVVIYIFLAEKCPISQYYTLPLRQMHEQYADEQVRFVGVFSNPDANDQSIRAFQEKYQIPFDCQLDKTQQQMNRFGVKITPEVVVVQAEKVLYQGRIDNTFFKLGKRRRITTSRELQTVLEAVRTQQAVNIGPTQAVGCFISKANAILQNAVMCQPLNNKVVN